MRLLVAVLLTASLSGPVAAHAQIEGRAPKIGGCTFDRPFFDAALATWEKVRKDALQIPEAPKPTFILFDRECVWVDGKARPHEGTIALPDGNEVPPGIIAFSSVHDGQPFLVMALPSVWREDQRHRENPRLETLMRGVFVHEMTHTRQAGSFGKRVGELERQHAIQNLSDDTVQDRFGAREGFQAAFEKERDLLFAIANETDASRRRAMAAEVLEAIGDRRARYFTGDDAPFAELEQLFFDLEGAANWAGFRAAMSEGLTRAEAIDLMRGSRRWFSQEEGLALYLAIDALTPGWQKRVFREEPATSLELLAAPRP